MNEREEVLYELYLVRCKEVCEDSSLNIIQSTGRRIKKFKVPRGRSVRETPQKRDKTCARKRGTESQHEKSEVVQKARNQLCE